MGIRVPPVYGEDYERQWNKTVFKGKRILDVGASNGDTADFFIRKGAVAVFAAEGNQDLYKQLESNSQRILEIVPILLWVSTKEHWAELISKYKPDIVKSDCEGCEGTLLQVPDEVFSIPDEYLLEVHSVECLQAFKDKWARNGFKVVTEDIWAPPVGIILARKDIKAQEVVRVKETAYDRFG